MGKFALAVGVLVGFAGSPAGAATVPVVVGAPADYIPGSTFTFVLHAPNLVDFTGYNIDFDVTTIGTVMDTILSLSVAKAGTADYPFGPGANFMSSVTPVATNQLGVNIADSTSPGVDTRPGGVGDFLVRVTVVTAPGATGDIAVAFNPGTLRVDRNEEVTRDVTVPDDFIIRAGASPQPVPAPAAWVTLGLGGLMLGAARKRFVRA